MLGYINDSFLRELTNEIRSGYERTISALMEHNKQLLAEIENQRVEHGETRQLLQRALRLEPRAEASGLASAAREHVEAVGRSKSWPKLKQELEQKFKRKPEDDAEQYWAEKNASMQAESQKLDETIFKEEMEKK